MYLSKIRMDTNGRRIVLSCAIGIVVIIVLGLIFLNDVKNSQIKSIEINDYEIAWLSPLEASAVYQDPERLNRLNFTPIPERSSLASTTLNPKVEDAKQGYFAVKIYQAMTDEKQTAIHFAGVSAENFSIYDETGKQLYQYEASPRLKYYTKRFSEFFIESQTDSIYLVGTYNEGYSEVGLTNKPQVGNSIELVTQNLEAYRIRQSVSIFLLLLTVILTAMLMGLTEYKAKSTIASIAIFFGLFGLWILFDFPRHSYWILKSFPQIPMVWMLLIFIVSKNYMTCAFVQTNLHFFEKSFSKRIVEALVKLTFVTGSVETLTEVTRLFIWSSQLTQIRDIIYTTTNWIIILGSAGLILMSFYEVYQGSHRAIILSIGLSICLLTFFVSQATPILISHWGVIAMATAIAIILTLIYNEAQQKSRRYTSELKFKNDEMALLNLELEYAQTELLLRLGSTVDMRSHETSLHVQRVAKYTRLIASKLGLSPTETDIITKASTLHDVGKVGIPDEILHMPGKLTTEQFEAMKKHARMGFEMLNGSVVQVLDEAAVIALTHHERYDGTGYPEGLSGDDIPIQGRIVSAADVIDALLSERVYKRAWSLDEVLAYFNDESGKHFAPEIVKIILDSRDELELIINSLPYENTI